MLKWLKSLFQKKTVKPEPLKVNNDNPSGNPILDLENSAIDVDFLRHLEGEELTAYVPKANGKVVGASGVTISVGFDLGQWDVKSLKGRIPDSLLAKVTPYLGLRKDVAVSALAAKPLRITKDESRILAAFAKEKTIDQLKVMFGTKRWEALDWALKTVLVSVAYQYGNIQKRCPTFTRLALAGDWIGLANELSDFGDAFPTRRQKEACYISDNSVLYLEQVKNLTKSKNS